MKRYPSMSSQVIREMNVYFFEKLDGSNIRAEWSPKRGFYKFGSRNQMIDEDHPLFGEAVVLIKKLEPKLSGMFRDLTKERLVAYFEFLGDNSFAGFHEMEPHRVALLDVEIYKQGFLSSDKFVDTFKDIIPTPKFIFYGEVTPEIEEMIRAGQFPGATFEGVVCKSSITKKWSLPAMFKIKNRNWVNKVMEKYKNQPELLKDLI